MSRRTTYPQVTRQEVLWVPKSRLVEMPSTERPYRVWTLYGPDREDPATPPKLPITPVHLNGAFLEDYVHDWNILKTSSGPFLKYSSRVALDSVWILLEYTS